MNADEFRTIALDLPEVSEGSHQGHADFRVGGKVFATLGPDESWAMLKLSPDEQAASLEAEPGVFEAFPGAWGRQGCTKVHLARARPARVLRLLGVAWRRTAPARIAREHEDDVP